MSYTKWLPLPFLVASFLSCWKIYGDFLPPPVPYLAGGIELAVGSLSLVQPHFSAAGGLLQT